MTSRTWLLVCSALITLGGCGQADDADDDFLDCGEQCDGKGSLGISSTWVPANSGVIKVRVPGRALSIEPNDGSWEVEERFKKGEEELFRDEGAQNKLVRFSKPGFYALSTGTGTTVVIRVSHDVPALELTDPEPAAMVKASPGTLTIHGTMVDPLGKPLTEARINGKQLSLGSDGRFSASVEAEFGLNAIELVAVDIAENTFTTVRSFLLAQEYSGKPAGVFVSLDKAALNVLADKTTAALPKLIQISPEPGPIEKRLGHKLFFRGALIPGIDGHPGEMKLELSPSREQLLVKYSVQGQVVILGAIDGLFDTPVRLTIDNPQIVAILDFPTIERDEFGRVVTGGGPFSAVIKSIDLGVVDEQIVLQLEGLEEFLKDVIELIDPDFFTKRLREEFETRVAETAPSVVNSVFSTIEGQLEVDVSSLNVDGPVTVDYAIAAVDIVKDTAHLWLDARVLGDEGAEVPAPVRPR